MIPTGMKVVEHRLSKVDRHRTSQHCYVETRKTLNIESMHIVEEVTLYCKRDILTDSGASGKFSLDLMLKKWEGLHIK